VSGYRESFVGFSAAVDYRPEKRWMVTSGFSLAAAKVKVPHGRTHADFTTYAGSLGAAWTPGSWFVGALASYLYSPVHAERRMHFTSNSMGTHQSVRLKAKHNDHSNQALGHFGAGHVFKIKASSHSTVNIFPFANIDYIYIPQGSYNERGAQSLDLHVASKKYNLLRPEAGLGIGYKGCYEDLQVMFDLSTSYVYEFRFKGKNTRAGFVPAGGCTFTATHGLKPENSLISPTARLRLATPNNGFSMTLGYHGEFGQHFTLNAGEIEFRLAF
jgi:uncharacterized protein with beta-barrel porin domain